jgi:hypothetical protein
MDEVAVAPTVEVVRNRYGYTVDGQRLRRVTTLLRGIPKDWLGNWAAKVVAEFAVEHKEAWEGLPPTDAIKLLKGSPWSKRDDAGDRGTAVHNALECYAKGLPVPRMKPDETACANAARRFLEARGSRTLAVELTVLSPKHGYAGTLDVWEIDREGVSWILDYKTSSGIYPEHAVQQAAYRNAEYAVVQKKPGTKDETWTGKLIPWGPMMAERLGIVHVTPEQATLYPIEYTDELWEVFKAAAFTKAWQLDTDSYGGKKPRKDVFGEPIPGPEAPADTGEIPSDEPEGQEAA